MDIANFLGLAPILMNEAGADGAGGGGESTALAITTGTEIAAGEDISGSGDGTGVDDASLATTNDNEPMFDKGGRLSQSTSRVFRQLEASNPNARNILARAQRALGTLGKFTSMLGPKPFDRISELRKFEREAGGIKGLQDLRASVEDMNKSDELYGKADPQLLEMMTESPQGKQAFAKLWPHTVNKIRELAPMLYTRWIGMNQLHSLEKAEISLRNEGGKVVATEPIDMPFRLRRIVGMIPWGGQDGKPSGGVVTPEQIESLRADLSFLFAYIDQIRSYANATPEDLTPPKEDTSKDQIAQARKEADEATQASWKVQRDSACNDILADEVRKQTKGMDLSSTIIADVTARARGSVNEIRKALPDNSQKIAGFFEGKNLNGYIAYNKRIVQDHAQAAVEKAVGLYARKSTRRTATAAPAAQATAAGTTATATAAAQTGKITRLTAQQMELLRGSDITRYMKQPIGNSPGTTMEMIRRGEYMLRKINPWGLPEGTVVQKP